MHQRSITMPQMSHIFEDLEFTGTIHEGSVWVTMGNHPDLGAVVTIQDETPGTVIMHSQFPPQIAIMMAAKPIRAH